MSRLLTCPRGHQWEANPDEEPGGSGASRCPLCATLDETPPPPVHVPETSNDLGPIPPAPASVVDLYPTGGGREAVNAHGGQSVVADAAGGPGPARYELLEELGRGGMGVVYKARQTGLKRLVALKMILDAAHAGPAAVARFRTEAEAVARLQHPNIVQIYETGEYDGRPYFSMELVHGPNLRKVIAGTPQPAGPAAALVETLARAMHAAHRQGIVHRDLKPANILLQSKTTTDHTDHTDSTKAGASLSVPSVLSVVDFFPKITDFGLAKKLEDDSGQTRTGAIMGTPNYMAPEQVKTEGQVVGPPADVYALGAILYELLTGRPPFLGPTVMDTLDQVRWQEPVPPHRLQPKVPRDLETVCLKCLSKEPTRRYGSAEELADDLRRFQANEPIKARPASSGERLVKWVRRRPADAALVAVSGAALLVLGGLTLWHYRDVRAQRDDARAGERQAQEARLTAEEGRRLAELRAKAQDHLAQARAAVDREDRPTAREHLAAVEDQVRPEPTLADLQTEAECLRGEMDCHQRARDDYRRFGQLRDGAFLYETLSAGGGAANVRKTREAARDALALFGVAVPEKYFTADERADIREGCYRLLLAWAAAEAHPLPGEKPADQARQALALLGRAAELRPPTQAYHLRRAAYLAQLGDLAGGDQERRRAQAVPPASALDHFLLGEDHYQHGDLAEAVRDFSRSLRSQPDHFWAQYYLAACYLNPALERPDLARASLDACLVQRRDIPWVYLLRGFAQTKLRDFEAAEADLRQAEQGELDPAASYGLHVNRGYLRLSEAMAAEPVARLRYAGALLPELLPCQVCGQVAWLRQERQLADAAADLRHAIGLKPDQYQAYVNLAQVHAYRQEWDSAAAQLTEAIRLEPGLALLYRERAKVCLRRHDPAGALRDFEQAAAREPAGSRDRADDLAQQGGILLDGGRPEEALRAYDAALEAFPDHAGALLGRAEALLRLERYAEAIRAMDHYEAKGKLSARFYRTRGLARARMGDQKGAVDDDTRALLLAPDAATHVHRGWAYLLTYGSPRQALADFEEALRLDPHSADAYSGRANSRAQLGRPAGDVITEVEQALSLDPRSNRVQYGAARVFAQLAGRTEAQAAPGGRGQERRSALQNRALQHLRQAVALFPAAQRAPFWRDCVAPDGALKSIRSSPGYLRLAAECARAGPAE
jgi:serine/threonine protein kinase/Tfp pilus assembly protein PilF